MTKNILITGESGYIGKMFESYVKLDSSNYKIDRISVRDSQWKNIDFSKFDCVLHLAAIVHSKKIDENVYKETNIDLTLELATKAKKEGVAQFVFLSTMAVYGNWGGISREINKSTLPMPNDNYGRSKYDAETGLSKLLQNSSTTLSIIRPPMVYGKDSVGNYKRLSKIAKSSPIFPHIDNERSMIHIDNLCEFIKRIIDNKDSGVFFPQNKEYVNTSELVTSIAMVNGKQIILTKNFNVILKPLIKRVSLFNKVFGSLKFDKRLSEYKDNYRVVSFEESVKRTELD
ncbi:NAD-dependent epimerase/dehydratase family protein [Shouchella sp. 1P09AA]|uniref:NAD-dependent epimerase/dehydratase family protein n=1 Tax=unclassified Shouchella TaxID=2893065 RepID=UPI0039A3B298